MGATGEAGSGSGRPPWEGGGVPHGGDRLVDSYFHYLGNIFNKVKLFLFLS